MEEIVFILYLIHLSMYCINGCMSHLHLTKFNLKETGKEHRTSSGPSREGLTLKQNKTKLPKTFIASTW